MPICFVQETRGVLDSFCEAWWCINLFLVGVVGSGSIFFNLSVSGGAAFDCGKIEVGDTIVAVDKTVVSQENAAQVKCHAEDRQSLRYRCCAVLLEQAPLLIW